MFQAPPDSRISKWDLSTGSTAHTQALKIYRIVYFDEVFRTVQSFCASRDADQAERIGIGSKMGSKLATV